jgi:hypothetical protein
MNEKQPSPSGQAGMSTTTRGANLATPSTAGGVVEAGKAIADDVKHVATEVAAQAKQQVTSQLEEKKDKAAQGLGSVAAAIRKTGEGLREHDELGVTKYADGIAEQIESFSNYVTSNSLGDLIEGAENFARREPVIFLGGAFLLGMVGARFLKASVPAPAYAGGYMPGDDSYDRFRDEPRPGYGRGEPRSAYGRDETRSTYGRDESRSAYGRDESRSTYGRNEPRSSYGRDESLSTTGREGGGRTEQSGSYGQREGVRTQQPQQATTGGRESELKSGTGTALPGTSTGTGTGTALPGTGTGTGLGTSTGTGLGTSTGTSTGTGSTLPSTGSTLPGTGSALPGTGSTLPGTGSTLPGTGSTPKGASGTPAGKGSEGSGNR